MARLRTRVVFLFPALLPAMAQGQAVLPEGDGMELIQGACVACHDVSLITNSTGYTHERWQYVIDTMIELPDPLHTDITQYLASNSPRHTIGANPGGRRLRNHVPGMACPDSRTTSQGSPANTGRHDLVDWHVRQPGRPA